MRSEEEIDRIMRTKGLYDSWKYRWCDGGACACMGCVNRTGVVDITRTEWDNWIERHPLDRSKLHNGRFFS